MGHTPTAGPVKAALCEPKRDLRLVHGDVDNTPCHTTPGVSQVGPNNSVTPTSKRPRWAK